MLCRYKNYITRFLQKATLLLCCCLFAASAIWAQQNNLNKDSNSKLLNPLLYNSFKNNVPANSLLAAYIKPAKGELMYWPNYPLTAAQIAERDRRNEQSLGQQIAGQIIETTINNLIYGRKSPVAVRPRF